MSRLSKKNVIPMRDGENDESRFTNPVDFVLYGMGNRKKEEKKKVRRKKQENLEVKSYLETGKTRSGVWRSIIEKEFYRQLNRKKRSCALIS